MRYGAFLAYENKLYPFLHSSISAECLHEPYGIGDATVECVTKEILISGIVRLFNLFDLYFRCGSVPFRCYHGGKHVDISVIYVKYFRNVFFCSLALNGDRGDFFQEISEPSFLDPLFHPSDGTPFRSEKFRYPMQRYDRAISGKDRQTVGKEVGEIETVFLFFPLEFIGFGKPILSGKRNAIEIFAYELDGSFVGWEAKNTIGMRAVIPFKSV